MAETDWKYLQYNTETGQKRTGDGPSGGASSLSDLDDTSISNPSDGQMLGYDGTAGKWKNVSAPGGNVDDVKVNGTSVVSNKVANITSYKEVTQAQYEALPDTKLNDGVLYAIKDGGQAVDGFPPLIYSDEEREVGVWRDGKPLYQKIVVLSATDIKNGSYQKYCDIPIGNIDTVAFMDCTLLPTTNGSFRLPYVNNTTIYVGYFIDEATSTYLRVQLRYGSDIGSNYWGGMLINIQYTKTTDTPGSGTWTTQGALAHHYSTEEHVIGTWIDGKPLYERSWEFDSAISVTSNTWTDVPISNSTIKGIIGVKGYNLYSGKISCWNGLSATADSGTYVKILQNRNTSVSIKYLTIQYTKTAD